MAIEYDNPIISEDYADLLIDIGKLNTVIEEFPNASIHPMNFLLSLINVPVESITEYTVQELGYGVLPAVLGLVGYDMETTPLQIIRNIPDFDLRGMGTLIAIIGTGIDYTNPIFRYDDGTTRIAAIWDQTIQSGNPPNGFLYGTEYSREQINLALQSEDPYTIVPTYDEIGHGTMIAGIAGGREITKNNINGVASNAEFIVIKLKPAKKYLKKFFCIPEEAIGYQESDITFALNYILNGLTVFSKPIAICLAVNTSEGAHDGRGTFNDYLSYIATIPGIAVIIGVGNEGNARRHYSGIADQMLGFDTVSLNIGENEKNFYMNLYVDTPSIFSFNILAPSGEYINNITPVEDEFLKITFTSQNTEILIDYQISEAQTGIQLTFIRFINPDPGVWLFTLNNNGDLNLSFHIWLPMEGFISNNTYFERSDPYTTVLSLATTTTTITPTAYDITTGALFERASKGFSRVGSITPNIAVPGVNIIGPTLDHSFAAFSGTSVSAAYMTGVAAMLLEWGVVRENDINLSSVGIKNLVNVGARRNHNMVYPNQDQGYGMLDINNIVTGLQ